MRNCPNCGSSAQVKMIDMNTQSTFYPHSNEIVVFKEYVCGCGEHFRTAQIFVASEVDTEDIVETWRNKEE